jgi:membrane fusion protein (multidrug efflux system)
MVHNREGFGNLEAYLRITAPFDGIVTDRLVHPGALVGPRGDPVLLVIQEVSHLRLVVALPEEDIGGIVRGARLVVTRHVSIGEVADPPIAAIPAGTEGERGYHHGADLCDT